MKKKSGARRSVTETRVLNSAERLEVRRRADGTGNTILGYATKFTPAMSDDLGGFYEQIAPHAFDECLAANPDVRALWNHDANHVLGRTKAGTLRLSVDKTGLLYEVDPPDTTFAKDLMVSMERGDVTQSSFGFICTEDTWRDDGQGNYIRTVLKAELFDVSPVTFPAYPDATSGVRHVRASLRNAPDAVRAKFRDLEDTDDEDGIDNDGDEGTDNPDEDCDCRCVSCAMENDCTQCLDRNCTRSECRSCPMQDEQRSDALRLRRHFEARRLNSR